MKLIGSVTSPYVRRFRMLLADVDYQFSNINVFGESDRKQLASQNPANRVPVIIDEHQVVFESRMIYRYLQQKLNLAAFDWRQENLLSLIDAATDSLIILLLAKRSNIDSSEDKLLFNLQRDRLKTIFPVLEQAAGDGAFTEWNYLAMSLYTLIDWASFRELWDLSEFVQLQQFLAKSQQQYLVSETDPRKLV